VWLLINLFLGGILVLTLPKGPSRALSLSTLGQ
jgi:hypothetical protein